MHHWLIGHHWGCGQVARHVDRFQSYMNMWGQDHAQNDKNVWKVKNGPRWPPNLPNKILWVVSSPYIITITMYRTLLQQYSITKLRNTASVWHCWKVYSWKPQETRGAFPPENSIATSKLMVCTISKLWKIWVGVSSDAILLVSSVAFGYTLWHILLPIRFNFQPDGLRNR